MSEDRPQNTDPIEFDVAPLVEGYISRVRHDLEVRIESWLPDVPRIQLQEVIGGLMARQVSLATQLAQAPSAWNGHVAPLILRAMTDVYITFAWIWGDAEQRSQIYVLYGLGQLKLHLEHLKAHVASRGGDPSRHPLVEAHQRALDAERLAAFTEVNIGSWSGTDTRRMAEEANCLGLYRFAYSPFSRATHSMWPHVSQYNLKPCINPLHRMHRVPTDEDWPLDVDYLYRAAKYVEKTMRLFDTKVAQAHPEESSFGWLAKELTTPVGDGQDPMFDTDEDHNQPTETS